MNIIYALAGCSTTVLLFQCLSSWQVAVYIHTYIHTYIHIVHTYTLCPVVVVMSLNLQLLYTLLSDLVHSIHSCASQEIGTLLLCALLSRTKLSTVFLGVSRHFQGKIPMNFQDVPKNYIGTVNQRLLENFLDMFVSKESLRCEAQKNMGYLLPQCISCRISDYYSDFYTNLPVASISLLAPQFRMMTRWWGVCFKKTSPNSAQTNRKDKTWHVKW